MAISVALLHSLIVPAFYMRVCTLARLSSQLVVHQSGSFSIN